MEQLKIVIFCLVFGLATSAPQLALTDDEKATTDTETSTDYDNEPADSNLIFNTIQALKPSAELFNNRDQTNSLDLGTFPYEASQGAVSTFPQPQPSFGIAINSNAVLGPKVELLYLLESTIHLIGDVLHHVQRTVNENYDLIRSLFNFVISKASSVKSLLLKGIGVLRKVLEFALNIFNGLSITLPSITFGSDQADFTEPHVTYGVPPSYSSGNNFTST